jgi:hypothetical protein
MSGRMNACRTWPQLMRLVKTGKLISITPTILSPEIFMKGDAYKRKICGKPMHPWTCEANARALVEAMQAEEGWAVVGGFALGPNPVYPTKHVWVRKGNAHFDPTWSIPSTVPTITFSKVPNAKYHYFALPGIFPEGDVCHGRGIIYLLDKAEELGIELLENHPGEI